LRRLVVITALAMCATACGAGSSVAPRTWQTGSDYAYVATDSGIVPINLEHPSVGAPLLAGQVNHGLSLAIAPGGRTAYIGYGQGITPLNLATGHVGKPFATRVGWSSFAMAPDGRTIYLSGFDNRTSKSTNEIIPVNTTNGLVGHPIPISLTGSNGVNAISPNGETAYVITEYGADITPVNLVTGLAGTPIGVPDGVGALAVTPDGTTAYAVGNTGYGIGGVNNLVPINLETGIAEKPIRLDFQADDVALSSNGRTAFLTDGGFGLRYLDLATGKVTYKLRMHDLPGSIAVPPE
jgi:hyaluronoglucosaminidase